MASSVSKSIPVYSTVRVLFILTESQPFGFHPEGGFFSTNKDRVIIINAKEKPKITKVFCQPILLIRIWAIGPKTSVPRPNPPIKIPVAVPFLSGNHLTPPATAPL